MASGSSGDKRKITRSLDRLVEAAETARNARLEIDTVMGSIKDKQAVDAARDRELDRMDREACGIR